MKKQFLNWLSKRCRDWSYDLCDLSSRLESAARGPMKPWVPQSPMEKALHETLLAHYRDMAENPTFLIDKVDRAKKFEMVGTFKFAPGVRDVRKNDPA